jgi:hypothetical protein
MGTDDNVVVAFDENLFRLHKQTQKRGWKWTELYYFLHNDDAEFIVL